MKVIFLDFDGVIRVPSLGGDSGLEAEFCHERMRRVARLAEEADVSIVVSSDWRHRFDRGEMIELLEPAIPGGALHEDWMTPILLEPQTNSVSNRPVPRGAEIVSWLANHQEVECFAVLDDAPSRQFPLMRDRVVTCQLLDGFTEERFETARVILSVAGWE